MPRRCGGRVRHSLGIQIAGIRYHLQTLGPNVGIILGFGSLRDEQRSRLKLRIQDLGFRGSGGFQGQCEEPLIRYGNMDFFIELLKALLGWCSCASGGRPGSAGRMLPTLGE